MVFNSKNHYDYPLLPFHFKISVMHFKLLLLLFIAITSSQCNKKANVTKPDIEPSPPLGKTYTYLALGDSYTIGHSVDENERFPVQLSDSLKAVGFDLVETRIIAKTGWTTDELANGIAAATQLRDTYNIVSLLIGVNNQYRSRLVETYKPEFKELLNQAIEFAGGNKERVFVVSIPDYAFTPFGNGSTSISAGIDEYNTANKEITEAMGIAYFDITPISREGLEKPELVADDGLHPSGEQYRRWVQLMLPDVKTLLE